MITLQERVHDAPPPRDWQLDKLHQVFRVRRGNKNDGMKEDNLLSLSYGRIIQKGIETADGLLPENFEGYQIVEPGNIVLRLTDLQNDKRSLRQGLVTQYGIITSAYDAVEVQRDNDPHFWFYSLLALDLAKYYYSLGGGVRQSVKFADFPNDWVYRPDLPTQRAIADFLDRETARIDSLIEKKNQLVELLGERHERQRESIMAVSDHDLPKQSIRWLIRVGSGNFVSNEELSSEQSLDHPIPVVGGNGIMAYTNRHNTPTNTLVVGRVGALCGNVHFFEHRSWVTDNALIVRLTSKDILPRYAFEVLTSAKLNEKANRSAQPLITGETVKNVTVHLPGTDEQQERVHRLGQLSEKLAVTKNTVNSSIDRLKEYRSALITCAVTGQIDVSTYARSGTTDRQLDAIQSEMQA